MQRNPWAAVAYNLILIGAGYLYLRRPWRFVVVAAAFIALVLAREDLFVGLLGLGLVMLDCYRLARDEPPISPR